MKVIDSFLVALGFDLDEESQKKVNSAIDGTKTIALQMGAALATALTGGGFAAKKTAKSIDQLGNSAKLLTDVTGSELDLLGRAIELIGGSADEAAPTLENLEKIIANLKVGEGTGLLEDLEKFGIPSDFVTDAKTSLGLLKEISRVMETLEPEKQARLADAFGLSEGVNLLTRQGEGGYSALIAEARELAQLDQQLIDQSREMTKSFSSLGQVIGNLFREFTAGSGPQITETINSWTKALKGFTDEARAVGEIFGEIADFLEIGGGDESDTPTENPRSQSSRRRRRKSYGESSQAHELVDYVFNRSQSAVVQMIEGGTRQTERQVDRRGRPTGNNINIDRLEIKVDGAANPDETARKTLEEFSKAAAQVAEEAKDGVAG